MQGSLWLVFQVSPSLQILRLCFIFLLEIKPVCSQESVFEYGDESISKTVGGDIEKSRLWCKEENERLFNGSFKCKCEAFILVLHGRNQTCGYR